MADATPTIVLTSIVHIVAFADCRIKYFASLDFSPAIKAMRIPISPKQDTIAVGLVPIGPPCHIVAVVADANWHMRSRITNRIFILYHHINIMSISDII